MVRSTCCSPMAHHRHLSHSATMPSLQPSTMPSPPPHQNSVNQSMEGIQITHRQKNTPFLHIFDSQPSLTSRCVVRRVPPVQATSHCFLHYLRTPDDGGPSYALCPKLERYRCCESAAAAAACRRPAQLPAAILAQSSKHLRTSVSYTHLTLPTTPYV